jgi:hypothetical protein
MHRIQLQFNLMDFKTSNWPLIPEFALTRPLPRPKLILWVHHSTYHNTAQSLLPHNTTFHLSDSLVTYLPLSANYELLQFICAQPDTTHFLIMLRQPRMLKTFPGCHPFPVNTYSTFNRPNLWRLKAERNTYKWTFTSVTGVSPQFQQCAFPNTIHKQTVLRFTASQM